MEPIATPLLRVWIEFYGGVFCLTLGVALLKMSDGFSRKLPALACVLVYALGYLCLTRTLKVLPLGLAYALWSGVGTILAVALGWWWFDETLTARKIFFLTLLVVAIVGINGAGQTELTSPKPTLSDLQS